MEKGRIKMLNVKEIIPPSVHQTLHQPDVFHSRVMRIFAKHHGPRRYLLIY